MPVNKSPPSSRTTSPKAVSPTVSPPNSPPRSSRAGTDASQQQNAAGHGEPWMIVAKAVLECDNQKRTFAVWSAPRHKCKVFAIEASLDAAQSFNPDDAYAKLANTLATYLKVLQLDVELELDKKSYEGCPLSMKSMFLTRLPVSAQREAQTAILEAFESHHDQDIDEVFISIQSTLNDLADSNQFGSR